MTLKVEVTQQWPIEGLDGINAHRADPVAAVSQRHFGGRVVAIDNLFHAAEHLALWKYFVSHTFYSNPEGRFSPIYRLTDGQSLVSTSTTLQIFREPRPDAPDRIGSANNPLGRLFGAMLADEGVRKLLQAGSAWNDLSFSCTIFPPGTGLGWHADQGHAAAFIYYVHSQGEDGWGGELLLERPAPDPESSERAHRPASHRDLYRAVSGAFTTSVGTGIYVAPRPNRLVVLGAGVRHTVKKVELAAGEAYRGAISGFFTERKQS